MDDTDFRILKMLSDNCRMPYEAIAKSVGLTGNAVRNRVQEMINSGVIERFCLCINPTTFGYNIIVAIFEQEEDGGTFDELKEIEGVMFVVDAINGVGAVVFIFREEDWSKKVESVFKTVKSVSLVSAFLYQKPISGTKIGKIDWKIIESLKDDIRKPIHTIADELKISTKTVKRHMDRLMDKEILRPMAFIQPMMMEDIIPYYLLIEIEGDIEKNRAASSLGEMFDRYWFKQKIKNSPLLIMQLYAHSLGEIEKNMRHLQSIREVKNAIFFYPSRVYFSDRYAEEHMEKRGPKAEVRLGKGL